MTVILINQLISAFVSR